MTTRNYAKIDSIESVKKFFSVRRAKSISQISTVTPSTTKRIEAQSLLKALVYNDYVLFDNSKIDTFKQSIKLLEMILDTQVSDDSIEEFFTFIELASCTEKVMFALRIVDNNDLVLIAFPDRFNICETLSNAKCDIMQEITTESMKFYINKSYVDAEYINVKFKHQYLTIC